MVIAVFGESCTGKSTLARELSARTGARVWTGGDWQRLEKNRDAAQKKFRELLSAPDANEVFVISEKEQLALAPEGCVRVLVTAELDVIKSRFARRLNGALPPPVAAMLERKHGMFDAQPCDIHISGDDTDAACARILAECERRKTAK